MAEPEERRIELLLRFAAAGHRAGYSSADLEERVVALARHLGVEGAQISVTPTLVELSVGALADQRSFSLRVRPKPVDLDAIARLDDLVLDVLASEVDVAA